MDGKAAVVRVLNDIRKARGAAYVPDRDAVALGTMDVDVTREAAARRAGAARTTGPAVPEARFMAFDRQMLLADSLVGKSIAAQGAARVERLDEECQPRVADLRCRAETGENIAAERAVITAEVEARQAAIPQSVVEAREKAARVPKPILMELMREMAAIS